MTFAYASLVTHQLFRTDPRDMSKNNTSSYLDLSVLYGINQTQVDLVRDKEKGRGLLYPDAFAEDRLVLVPPAAFPRDRAGQGYLVKAETAAKDEAPVR